MKRIAIMVMVFLFMFSLSVGCSKNSPSKTNVAPGQTAEESEHQNATQGGVDKVELPYPWMDPKVEDTSDLPTWTGKQLKLTWWMGHGIGNLPADVSSNDVITPEIQRVTGVTIDYDNSYGNGDNTFDVKLSLLAGTKDWPSILTHPQVIKPLIENDAIYDLTELVPKYCPTLVKLFPPDDPNFKSMWNSGGVNGGFPGKIYGIPIMVGADYPLVKDKLGPIQDEKKFLAAFMPPPDYHQSCIKIRDDILKKLYPQAKTMDEIEALYMEKGGFTREDVFDVPIRTKEDFFKLLRDIKALNLKEGNLPVYPTYAACGLDNYPLAARLASQLYGWGGGADCFTYWDNETKEVKFTFWENELRELYKTFNQLIREGVIPAESLIDDDTAFKAKMNNGQYAITYAEWRWPDDSVLAKAGKPYRYRPLYLDIPINTQKYVQPINPPSCDVMVIFKDKVAKEDLPQLLRWIDYQFSEVFLKAQYWGPRSAGLFEEVNGKRVFKDKTLEDAMLYNNDPNTLMRYNLINGFFNPAYNVRRLHISRSRGPSGYAPYMMYDNIKRDKSNAINFFKSGLVESYPAKMTMLPWIWNFPERVPGVGKMWAARTTWEDALKKTLAARSDEEFDRLYDNFIKISKEIGLTEETLKQMNEDFKKQNEQFMNNLLNN